MKTAPNNNDDMIENRTYDELEVGDSAGLSHILTMRDIHLFAIMSGDVNPAHLDEEYARSDMFQRIIGHGMWSASLISTVLGTQLPGPGTIYIDQDLHFVRPVMLGDTVTAKVTVKEKKEKGRVALDCVCTNQHGKEVVSGIALVIAPDKKIRRPVVELPEVDFKTPRQGFIKQLHTMTEGMKPLRTAVVHAMDDLSLKGAIAAAEEGIIEPVFVGPEGRMRKLAEAIGLDLNDYECVNTRHSHAAAAKAVELARKGEVEALMKGKIHTDELMAAVVDKTTGLRTARRMSHVFALDIETYHKPLFISDAALNIQPSLMDKKDIVQNAIDLFRGIGLGAPKVAILSAVETVNEKLPSTLDATALCKMSERGQICGGILDGPLAFDNAVSPESARVKGILSPVAGDADILIVPDIESGNMLYKQMRFLSHADGAGLVLGARVPIILTSRAGDEEVRMASCAMALAYMRKRRKYRDSNE